MLHCLGGFNEILVLGNELSKQSNALINVSSIDLSFIPFMFLVSEGFHLDASFSSSFSLNPPISLVSTTPNKVDQIMMFATDNILTSFVSERLVIGVLNVFSADESMCFLI